MGYRVSAICALCNEQDQYGRALVVNVDSVRSNRESSNMDRTNIRYTELLPLSSLDYWDSLGMTQYL